jgi:hypothetical protein
MRWWACVVLVACGRVDFDVLDAPLGPFSPPMLITELASTYRTDDPALTGDELELYFDTERPGGLGLDDIWRTTRASTRAPWGASSPVLELSTPASEVSPGISLDGLTIFLTTPGGGGTGYDFWTATRPDRASPWTTPVRVDELSATGEDTNPQISADGLSIYFASRRGGTAQRQIWTATRASVTSPWNPPVRVEELFVAPDVYTGDPHPNATDTRLYFISDRGGEKDLWIAERASRSEPFGEPAPIEELSSPYVETDPWVSVDEHRIYYARLRPGAVLNLYMATR